MGVAYTLSCTHCTYSQNIFLGIGFQYTSLKVILEWYEQEEGRQHIKEFMNREDTHFDCYDGLYVCQSCGYLLNDVFLHMESKGDSYTNRYDCPRCHSQMSSKPLLDEVQSDSIDCPECKESKLNVQGYMDWD